MTLHTRQRSRLPITQLHQGARGQLVKFRGTLPAILVAYACLLPRELAFAIGEVDFRPYRIMLILVLPATFRLLKARPVQPSFFDFCALMVSLWHPTALIISSSIDTALSSGLGQGLDFGLAYFVGRICLRNPHDVRQLLIATVPAFALVGALIMLESITHHQFVRFALAEILNKPQPISDYQVRWGLLRSMGPFPHPILGGTMLASLFPLVLFILRSGREKFFGMFAVFCCLFSVSSTAFLNLIAGIGLALLIIVQRATRWPVVWIALAYGFLGAVSISLLYNGGLMKFVVQRMTVSADSGYWRLFIWQFAGAEANAHPWFGIGMRDWSRPDFMRTASVDTQWLLMTMTYGYPVLIFLGVILIGGLALLAWRSQQLSSVDARNVCVALVISMVTLTLSGLSVALWEGIWIWMVMLIGAIISHAQEISYWQLLRKEKFKSLRRLRSFDANRS